MPDQPELKPGDGEDMKITPPGERNPEKWMMGYNPATGNRAIVGLINGRWIHSSSIEEIELFKGGARVKTQSGSLYHLNYADAEKAQDVQELEAMTKGMWITGFKLSPRKEITRTDTWLVYNGEPESLPPNGAWMVVEHTDGSSGFYGQMCRHTSRMDGKTVPRCQQGALFWEIGKGDLIRVLPGGDDGK